MNNKIRQEMKSNTLTTQEETYNRCNIPVMHRIVIVPLMHNCSEDNKDLSEQEINKQKNLNNSRIFNAGTTRLITKTKTLNPNVQKDNVVVWADNKKKLEQAFFDSARNLTGYGRDLICLTLIMLIPTIPFWQF
jgi:hypothetical protein